MLWNFACGHRWKQFGAPVIPATKTSQEECPECKENKLRAGTEEIERKRLNDEQALSTYEKQAKFIEGQLAEARKLENEELIKQLEKSERTCVYLWVDKIKEIELKKDTTKPHEQITSPKKDLKYVMKVLELMVKADKMKDAESSSNHAVKLNSHGAELQKLLSVAKTQSNLKPIDLEQLQKFQEMEAKVSTIWKEAVTLLKETERSS